MYNLKKKKKSFIRIVSYDFKTIAFEKKNLQIKIIEMNINI